MKRRAYIFLYLLLSTFCADAQDAKYNEQLLKAGMLSKIIPYIHWESKVDTLAFSIKVLGVNSIEDHLVEMFSNTTVHGRKVTVNSIKSVDTLQNCDLLFISSDYINQLSDIKKQVKDKNVLLVSDSFGSAYKGVHVNFFITIQNKLRFEINKKSIEADGFKIDPMLLQIAKIINR